MKNQVQRSSLLFICSGFVLVFTSSVLIGQAWNGSIGGSVSDEAGALVPDASIDLVDVETGLSRSASTDDQGTFLVSLLRPSTYRLTVRRVGFATSEIRELNVKAGDRVHLNVTLRVGEPTEVVEVGPDALFVQSGSSDLSTLIGRRVIEEVPLNGRSFQSLVALAPGVVMTRSDVSNQGQFSVNGQRADSNYFLVDGVSANFGAQGPYSLGGTVPATNAVGGTASLVSIDAVEEVNVRRTPYSAEFGRAAGGQISVTTRSGTNRFRGSVFEYFRNDALDANDWFANANGLGKAPLRHNDFGGILGGPIVRDRSFFFFSYEGLRLIQPTVVNTAVASLALRQAVPENLRPLLDAYPLPNGAEVTPSRARYVVTYSDPRSMDAASLRIDHRLNDKTTIFGRLNLAPSQRSTVNLSTVARTDTRTDTITIGSTQILSNRSANEMRVNVSRSRALTETDIEEINGAVRPPDALLYPQPFGEPGLTAFSFSIESASISVGSSGQRQNQFNLIDNFSITRGDHQLRFGFDLRLMRPVSTVAKYAQFIQTTPGLLADGRASRVSVFARLGDLLPRYTNFSVYGEDVWQASPRLTMTYGLRWDLNPPPSEKNGNYPMATRGGFDPEEITIVPGAYPFWKTRYTNFAPRVGASYQLTRRSGSETVIRGGFGVFYDLAMGNASAAMRPFLFPYTGTRTLTNVSIPLSEANAAPPVFNLNPPYQEVFVFDPELKTPRTYEWSLGVEQAIGPRQSVSVSYVETAGRRLISDQFFSQPNPLFFRLHIIRDTGSSDYRSLQVQYQRRSNRGFDALVSYTLGRSMDTSSNDSSYLNTADPKEIRADRGPSDFDVRHSLSAALTYRVPTFRIGRLLSPLLNGWSVSGILTARSATPITYIQAFTTICEEFFCFASCEQFANSLCPRPDLVPGEPIYLRGSQYPGGKRLNPAAFTAPPPGRQGTLGRNALRSFSATQFDLSLKRSFRLGEKRELQLTGEVFNIFNHPNFADPDGFLFNEPFWDELFFGLAYQMLGRTGGTTGSAGEAGLNPIYQLGTPRSIQLAVRLKF